MIIEIPETELAAMYSRAIRENRSYNDVFSQAIASRKGRMSELAGRVLDEALEDPAFLARLRTAAESALIQAVQEKVASTVKAMPRSEVQDLFARLP